MKAPHTIIEVDVKEAYSVLELFSPVLVLVVNDSMTAEVFQVLALARRASNSDDLAVRVGDGDLRYDLAAFRRLCQCSQIGIRVVVL